MEDIEVSISLDTNNPRDIRYQNELNDLKNLFEPYNPELIPLKDKKLSNQITVKSPDVELLVGSIKLVLPAGALVGVLTSFIKSYFESKRHRTIFIKTKKGETIKITGYNETEIRKLLDRILENQQ